MYRWCVHSVNLGYFRYAKAKLVNGEIAKNSNSPKYVSHNSVIASTACLICALSLIGFTISFSTPPFPWKCSTVLKDLTSGLFELGYNWNIDI